MIDKNLLNSKNTGAAIKRPVTTSVIVWRNPPAGRPSDKRRPRTASTKHNAQLKVKPRVVSNMALAKTPADTQAVAAGPHKSEDLPPPPKAKS